MPEKDAQRLSEIIAEARTLKGFTVQVASNGFIIRSDYELGGEEVRVHTTAQALLDDITCVLTLSAGLAAIDKPDDYLVADDPPVN